MKRFKLLFAEDMLIIILESLISETFTPGKRKDATKTKMQSYKSYANDANEILSTTTDKRTTDERIELSYRTLNSKVLQHIETHRDAQERKALQKIEETLEREYKFYQVKTNAKGKDEEKVPEMLLRLAADDTIKKLCKISSQYTNILMKVRD